ncbi:extracellular solute-binding protein [Alphaproteobacteria bacterium HT1-32]|nr:extracellular solute-binding protein [Alphaproteobacteria bacterium HT1-32]
MLRRSLTLAAATMVGMTGAAATSQAAGEVNLYSYRQEFLVRPFLEKFEADTGIKVNVVYASDGILERLKAEGANSPADVVLTVDVARLKAIADANLFQPVSSPVLKKNIPEQYVGDDGGWYALTLRSRILYASRERVPEGAITTYEDLADPKWKGRICTRSGKHVYNRSLIASMIAAHGEEKAEEWAKAVVANFARKPQGNDRAQVKAVHEGQCDIAIGNTYYYALMKNNEKQPEQKDWAASVRPVFPNQDGRGAHVNASGAGVLKSAKNKENAIKLLEFLSSDIAQEMYGELNHEYPVKPGVPQSAEVRSWGEVKFDTLALSKISDNAEPAARLADRAGWQ